MKNPFSIFKEIYLWINKPYSTETVSANPKTIEEPPKVRETTILTIDKKRINVKLILHRKPTALELICADDASLNLTKSDSDFFNCLCQIRLELEKKGIKILCNGARVDVWPSGMMRDMSNGILAYIMKMGLQSKVEDRVNIFEPAKPEEIGTVHEQSEYAKNWFKSFGTKL